MSSGERKRPADEPAKAPRASFKRGSGQDPDENDGAHPPRVARMLLATLLPARVRDAVLEELDQRHADRNLSRAWYWRQTLRSIGPALSYRFRSAPHVTPDPAARDRGEVRDHDPRHPSRAGLPEMNPGDYDAPRKKTRFVESLLQDLMYALRSARRNPGFAAVVILTLGVGIGINTAIFSVVNGVLLEPLPYGNAARLMMVSRELTASGERTAMMQAADGVALATRARSIEAVVVFSETVIGPMTGTDTPLHVKQARASANVFEVFGVRPHIGRTFVPADGTPPPTPDGASADEQPLTTAVISYGLWQRAFGGDPSVLGKRFDLWGFPHIVVGVLPPDFRLLTPPAMNIGTDIDVFSPLWTDFATVEREEDSDFWRLVALRSADATFAEAREETAAVSAVLRRLYPYNEEHGVELRLDELQAGVVAPVHATLTMLMGAVSFVLLIACANVANLLLVRSEGRRSEIAVRVAMGAGRGRIVRQLLAEAAVLALASAVLGLGLAAVGVRVMTLLRPGNLPRVADISVDTRVLLFTLGAALVAILAAGLLPAMDAARSAPARALGVRGSRGPARRPQRALVVVEVALSMVLLIGAGVMTLTFAELRSMPLGFEPARAITVTVTQDISDRTLEQSLALERELVADVAALPGVEAAGVVFPVPMNGVYDRSAEFAPAGREEDPAAWNRAYFRTVSPTYFESVGLTLRAGRGISRVDADIDTKTVVIDERLAAQHFRGRNPIGERIRVRGMREESPSYEIVGVVEYAPQWNHRDQQPTMYFHRVQYMSAEISVVARIAGDPGAAARMVLDAVRATAPGLPADLAPLSRFVEEALSPTRFVLALLGGFSAMAVLLAAVGLYAVLAYSVRRQVREIGIRIALGAQWGALVRRVVGEGTLMAALGAGLGLIVWSMVGRLLESQLYGVGAMDPRALAATALVLIMVAALASWVPARRAARVDPAVALRSEH